MIYEAFSKIPIDKVAVKWLFHKDNHEAIYTYALTLQEEVCQ